MHERTVSTLENQYVFPNQYMRNSGRTFWYWASLLSKEETHVLHECMVGVHENKNMCLLIRICVAVVVPFGIGLCCLSEGLRLKATPSLYISDL